MTRTGNVSRSTTLGSTACADTAGFPKTKSSCDRILRKQIPTHPMQVTKDVLNAQTVPHDSTERNDRKELMLASLAKERADILLALRIAHRVEEYRLHECFHKPGCRQRVHR